MPVECARFLDLFQQEFLLRRTLSNPSAGPNEPSISVSHGHAATAVQGRASALLARAPVRSAGRCLGSAAT